MSYYDKIDFFEKNKEQTEGILNEFKAKLNKDFYFHVKDVEVVYNNRNVALTLKVVGHSGKPFITAKIGVYYFDNYYHVLSKDRIKFNKTEDLDLATVVMKYVNRLSDMFHNS